MSHRHCFSLGLFLLTLAGGNLTVTVQRGSTTSDSTLLLRFSLLSSLFGTRSEGLIRIPGFTISGSRAMSNPPPRHLPVLVLGDFYSRSKKQQPSRTSRVEYCSQFGRSDQKSCMDRGMSPVIQTSSGGECDRSPPGSSPEVSPRWKRTPTAGSRARIWRRNKSGMAFCLSPLVRASPNRQWNQKSGLSPEMTYTSESRPPVKPLGHCGRILCK
ncbi:Detected protein of unknown function [Hibiscus syriacus]|uniref:Secreted protein n=1 Tax=Hibiscus syriacus TaxID=106335 RepID=A0A6A3C0R2_HIBSY|nr:Detected protein of unknown function [Hibiscus syriacus]